MPSVSLDIIAVDSASNILQNIAGSFGAMGAAAAAGIGLATGAFMSLLEAGSETQDTMARFNSLVDSSPLAGYKDQMLELADATAKKTRFDNDSILAAEGQLAVYTSIGQTVFPDALKATINLATYMETDAPAAAKTLGRALEAIGDGSLSLLTKQKLLTVEQKEHAQSLIINSGASAAYGYELDHVSDSVRHQVDQLQAAGHMTEAYKVLWGGLGDAQRKIASEMRNADGEAEAQAYVIDILNGKIGNLAEDMGKTFPGQLEIMNNKFHDFWQEQGSRTEDTLIPLISMFNELGDDVLPFVSSAFDIFRGSVGSAVQALGLLSNGYSLDYVLKFSDIGKPIDWGDVAKKAIDGFFGFDWGKAFADLGKGVDFSLTLATNMVNGASDAVKETNWQKIADSAASGIDGVDWSKIGKSSAGFLEAVGKLNDSMYQSVLHLDFTSLLKAPANAITNFLGGAFLGTGNYGIQIQIARILGDVSKNLTQLGKNFENMKKTVENSLKFDMGEFKKNWEEAAKSVDPFSKALEALEKLAKRVIDLISGIKMPSVNAPAATGTAITVPDGLPDPGVGTGNSAGADFIVPPGYPNDSFPMRVESGEHVIVTPANRTKMASSNPDIGGGIGTTLINHGTIIVQLSPDKTNLAGFLAELGAAM